VHGDGYTGVVVGLAGAACLVLVERLSGAFTGQSFLTAAAEVVTVLTVSWLVGILGRHLRASVDQVTRRSAGTVRPTANLMGVLGPDIGLHRLDEELARRHRTGGPLALALLAHRPAGPGAAHVPEPARRAIARQVESAVSDADVVFAVDDETLALILPAADWTAALSAVGRVAVAASQATYADPVDRRRRGVSDTVGIRTALVFADDTTPDARSLVAAAHAGLGPDDGASA
jgi:hypothetical protein